MRKKTFTLLMFMVGATSMFAQVNKVPLIESFSQASCGPCAPENAAMLTTLNAFGEDNYVRVSHQVMWPGVDPMNAEFPEGPEARRVYYNVQGVPEKVLNGSSSTISATTLSTAAAEMTPYSIAVSQVWSDPNTVSVNIDVENVTGAAISDADRIYVTLLERVVQYTSAPGANGETTFRYVMRQMYDATNGNEDATSGAALGTINANSTENFSFTISSIPSYIQGKGELLFAVYVQNDASKEIYQAGKSDLALIPGLISVAAESNSTVASDFCDYSFSPSLNFTSNDPVITVTEVVAQYTVNGGTPVTETFTGSLGTGESTVIDFPVTTLSAGQNIVQYSIVSVNGTQDWSSASAITMEPEVYNKLSSNGTVTPFSEGFENVQMSGPTTRQFDSGIMNTSVPLQEVDFSVIDGPVNELGAVGGFAASDRCAYFGFYSVQSGTMDLIFNKVNIGAEAFLSFDHAYAQFSGAESDELNISVSTDCGATWTSVFSESGDDLKTAPPTEEFFAPTSANQWVRNEVDLSAYANTDEVVLKFAGISNYGNNMYIDNIYLGQSIANVEDLEVRTFSLYPNPASDFVSIRLSEELESDREVKIFDMKGQVVKIITVVSGASKVDVNTSDLNSGIYTIRLNSTSRKLIIK